MTNLKDSRKLQNSKNEFNNSRGRLAFKKKIKNFKSLRRISKENISTFKNSREISKMKESFQKWIDLNDDFDFLNDFGFFK